MIKDSCLSDEIEILDYSDREGLTYEFYDRNNVNRGFRGMDTNAKISVYDFTHLPIFVIKLDGRLAWCGMGDQKYYPPEIWIGILKENVFVRKFEIIYNRKNKKFLKDTIADCVNKLKEKI